MVRPWTVRRRPPVELTPPARDVRPGGPFLCLILLVRFHVCLRRLRFPPANLEPRSARADSDAVSAINLGRLKLDCDAVVIEDIRFNLACRFHRLGLGGHDYAASPP